MVETNTVKEETATTEKKTGKRKWLSRIAHFLMYGGWILVMALVVGVWVAISLLTQGK